MEGSLGEGTRSHPAAGLQRALLAQVQVPTPSCTNGVHVCDVCCKQYTAWNHVLTSELDWYCIGCCLSMVHESNSDVIHDKFAMQEAWRADWFVLLLQVLFRVLRGGLRCQVHPQLSDPVEQGH